MSSDPAEPVSPVRRAVPHLWRIGVCAMSSGLLAGSFHPFQNTEGVWFGLVPLLVLARFTPTVSAFGWGWLAGFGFWLVDLLWFLRLGDTGVAMPVAVLAWLAISAYAALYNGIFMALASEGFRWTAESPEWRDGGDDPDCAYAHGSVEPQSWPGRFRRMLLLLWLPIAWVGVEWLRSTLFTGFPWNTLGISQYRFTPIIQIAAWGGVYAVSALILLVNVSIALLVLRTIDQVRYRKVTRFHPELAVALIVFAACLLGGRSALRDEADVEERQDHVLIAWVQPAIPQLKKWDDAFFDEITNSLDRQTRLAAIMKPDLVVWPETAVPVGPGSTEADWKPFVGMYVTSGVPLLAGVLEFELKPPDQDFVCYNSSVLVDTNGAIAGRYRKQHLVPFGEYIPTESWIPFMKTFAPLGFSCEPGTESTVLRVEPKGFALSPLICFEDIFAGLARAAVRRGAGFLVNQTNDAWFDDTALPVQHMTHAVFRCVENRIGMVRVANTGVSCFIDRTGLIQDVAAMKSEGWNLGMGGFAPSRLAVRRAGERLTVYTRWGDWVLAIPCAAVTVAALVLAIRRIRREARQADVGKEQS